MTGKGLSAQYRFTRQPCIYGNSMVSLQLTLSNSGDHALENIHISEQSSTGQDIYRFNTIGERVNKARASECVTFPRAFETEEFRLSVSVFGVSRSIRRSFTSSSLKDAVAKMGGGENVDMKTKL